MRGAQKEIREKSIKYKRLEIVEERGLVSYSLCAAPSQIIALHQFCPFGLWLNTSPTLLPLHLGSVRVSGALSWQTLTIHTLADGSGENTLKGAWGPINDGETKAQRELGKVDSGVPCSSHNSDYACAS